MVLYALLATLLAVYWNRALPGDGGLARAENGYNGAHRERLLLVGQAPELSVYVQALATVSEDAYGVAGIVTPHGEDRASTIGGHRVIGQITELPVILETLSADRLVLVASGLSQAEMRAASEAAARFGLRCVTVDFGLPASRVPATRGSAHPAEGGT
jgi:FlaA1/EpsC-like NDP-sugar epimerase